MRLLLICVAALSVCTIANSEPPKLEDYPKTDDARKVWRAKIDVKTLGKARDVYKLEVGDYQ
jgi:hypothetical protein